MIRFCGKRHRWLLTLSAVVLVLLVSATRAASPVRALESGSIEIHGAPALPGIQFLYTLTGNVNGDGDGYDWFVIALFDCNGNLNFAFENNTPKGITWASGMTIP